MAKVTFTAHLRHIAPPETVDVPGATVAEALAEVFEVHPGLRGYILDDQDRLRLHIAVFVDAIHVRKDAMNHPLMPGSELHVLQALSGG